uniref:Uncharacterized protein n=1 Tax=Rhizophora mucronata TaxID=61149 RepID=A0A2P2JSF4_RHIMU
MSPIQISFPQNTRDPQLLLLPRELHHTLPQFPFQFLRALALVAHTLRMPF